MKCDHDLAEKETAMACDGICPICLCAENERLREALERIRQWAKAYPLKSFPEPDFKAVHQVLKEHGMSLDEVSASNMRHVIKGVSEIVEQALKG